MYTLAKETEQGAWASLMQGQGARLGKLALAGGVLLSVFAVSAAVRFVEQPAERGVCAEYTNAS